MMVIGLILLALAALPAVLSTINLTVLGRTPLRPAREGTLVSILIPARNEAANIRPAVEAALASRDVAVEVLVMDDGSTDGTADIVRSIASRDARVRLLNAPPLTDGWTGKIHACHHLSEHARGTHFLFVDADVRLSPQAASLLAGHAQETGARLVSAVPRQIMKTPGELLTIPMINLLLLGYLPMGFMRASLHPGFGAACGQLMLMEREAYRASGGHAAIRSFIHDGIQLARLFRHHGFMTDLVPGERLASCRMYTRFTDAWNGFAKNAHEGMAKPVALPIWTALLLGGHVLPFALLPIAPIWPVVWAASLSLATRAMVSIATRENPLSILVHPLTVLTSLAIQWGVLLRIGGIGQTGWKGRCYPVGATR
ncbi:glycosyltransferase [Microvirga guangxiensis]|uniref:Glycosyltransferase like family 2 n=1 Tax=Microvirga guangxiensis TaxID=549386 RepID=A0A1G5EF00_9HYPH|nr:glycosyltransferase family 2 protein [Microvirga guangxiensis]SCY25525.1 Glycosyltransferase like family 2 [Microvirga guangxiensis]